VGSEAAEMDCVKNKPPSDEGGGSAE